MRFVSHSGTIQDRKVSELDSKICVDEGQKVAWLKGIRRAKLAGDGNSDNRMGRRVAGLLSGSIESSLAPDPSDDGCLRT